MQDIKYIITQLNKEPFKKNFNLVTYDNLRGEQRIQILFEIFHALDERITSDVLEVADAEEVVIKILEMLRILKYTPPPSVEPSVFRQNLITGERNTLSHIFYYLLSKLPELKKRAYLARFLVKIEVSPDVEGDQDIVQLYEQYEQLIENFKLVHSSHESLKKSLDSVQELQRDIKAMENEKEQIQEKLSNIKRKVDENQDPAFFQLVRTFREEKEKNDSLVRQISSQDAELEAINNKLEKVKSRLKKSKMNYQMGSSPQNILEKMEEEVEAKRRLVKEILPQELASLERYVHDIEEIESQPALLPNYLEKIKSKIEVLNKEINEMIEKKMLTGDSDDEKLALVRQSATLVAKKRSNLQENLKESMVQLEEILKKLEEKKMMFDGEEILKGDELKRYVNDIRNKGNIYKQKRRELAEIRTEAAILVRTEEILKQKWTRLEQVLITLEEQRGIIGYFTAQDDSEKSLREEEKQNAEELRTVIRQLNDNINEKKAELAPLIKDLRPLRQEYQDLQVEHDQKKAKYDALAADLESSVGKLESMVKKMRNESSSLLSSKFTLEMELEALNATQKLLELEMRYYVSNDVDEKEKSWQAKIDKEIMKEEEKKDELRTRLRDLQENESNALKQLKIWKDLKELLVIKNECLERREDFDQPSQEKKDHLIL